MRRALWAAAAAGVVLFGVAGSAYGEANGDTAVTRVVVNGGKDVAVGITDAKSFTVTLTATDDSGIRDADLYLYGPAQGFLGPVGDVACTASSATGSTCTGSFTVDPRVDLWDNDQAGTWYVAAWVDANDGGFLTNEKAGSFRLQRYSRLTANATPEPVSRGGTVTVSGALTRANWETRNYTGYTSQSVALQFRTTSGSYNPVKTVTSGTGGAVKTTVTASVDGCWRWSFAGTTTTPAVVAAGDCVDVR